MKWRKAKQKATTKIDTPSYIKEKDNVINSQVSFNLGMVGSILLVQCLLLILIAKKLQIAKEKVFKHFKVKTYFPL